MKIRELNHIIYRITLLLVGGLLCLHGSLFAQQRHRVDRSTDVLMFVPAVTGLTVALCEKDYTGIKQLALSGVTSAATNYLLELSIKKDRPDGTGHHAFPSTHVTASFTGAAYLQRRYGWKWGVPAYAVSAYVAWGRIYAKKHDIWDVLAGAAIGLGSGYLYTRPFAKHVNLVIAPTVLHEHPGIYLSANF